MRNPKSITSMVAVEGWVVQLVHGADCGPEVRDLEVVTWTATEMHGVQPVCVSADGSSLELVEEVRRSCTAECTMRIHRVGES